MDRTKKEARKTGIFGEIADRKEVEQAAKELRRDFGHEYSIEAVHSISFSYLSIWGKEIYVTS